MLKTKSPACLCNAKDLQLGAIYLKHLGYWELPSLMTIYELEKPAIISYNEIKKILADVSDQEQSGYAVKGLFSLAIAHFETMISDLIKKFLQFFPQKISLLKYNSSDGQGGKRTGKDISISASLLGKAPMLEALIENEITRFSYSELSNQIKTFSEIFSLKEDFVFEKLDQLIEIKETRNLLLHNNLYVNEFYLNKTKSVRRSSARGQLLSLDKNYIMNSLNLILEFSHRVVTELRRSFGKFTLLHMLKQLWRFTFSNESILFEKFSTLNFEEDIFDGPFTLPTFLSSSEIVYMELWRAQRTFTPLSSISMANFDSGGKFSFLMDVFGELRLPHWDKSIK